MIKYPGYVILVLIAACIIAWTACTQVRQPCLTPKTAVLVIESIHLARDTSIIPIDTALPGAAFVPVLPLKDTLPATLYGQQSLFQVSLSPDSAICQWTFRSDTFVAFVDTLTFKYKPNLQFLSNACGYTYFYTLDTVITTHRIIDSVRIINTHVTNSANDVKHVQIFIHPDF